jgi:hypothetical protein
MRLIATDTSRYEVSESQVLIHEPDAQTGAINLSTIRPA